MLLKLICSNTGGEYKTLIFHTKFCWLSRGKFLMIVFELMMKLQLLFGLKQEHH